MTSKLWTLSRCEEQLMKDQAEIERLKVEMRASNRFYAEAQDRLYRVRGENTELRAENERLRAAAKLPDPVFSDRSGRLQCVYCGPIEDDGHTEACLWVRLNVVLSLGRE